MTFIRKLIRYSLLIGFCYIFVCVCKSLSLLEILNKDWIPWLKIEYLFFIYAIVILVFFLYVFKKEVLTELHILLKKHLLMIKFILICLMIISFYKSYNTLLMILFIFEFLFIYCLLNYEANKQYTYDFNQLNGMSSFTEQTVIGKEKLTRNQRRVYNQLENLINKRKRTDSFNIGLIGSWGSGKTSITDTLIYELEKENNYFFLKISALTFNETGNIIEYVKDFFGDLFKKYEIDYYFGDSNVAFLGSLAMLNNNAKSIKDIVESLKGNSFVDLEKERFLFNDQVRRLLEVSKRKNIILMIDDMDRTYHQDNIIKLLNEFASINGLITIVSLNKDLNKKEEGQEYSELDKYIHVRLFVKENNKYNEVNIDYDTITKQILEAYEHLSNRENDIIELDFYKTLNMFENLVNLNSLFELENTYSLFELVNNEHISINNLNSYEGEHSVLFELLFENLKNSQKNINCFLKELFFEFFDNSKELNYKANLKKEKLRKYNEEIIDIDLYRFLYNEDDDGWIRQINKSIDDIFEILILIYQSIDSVYITEKNNINNIEDLYLYTVEKNKKSYFLEKFLYGIYSLIFTDNEEINYINQMIKNRESKKIKEAFFNKIEKIFSLLIGMLQLEGFMKYMKDCTLNYRSFKISLRESILLDKNYLEYIIDEFRQTNWIQTQLNLLFFKYPFLRNITIYPLSIENLINNVLIRKYIFGYDYKLTKSEINGNCLYIYHGSKRKIVILLDNQYDEYKYIYLDMTGKIISKDELSEEEKKEIETKNKTMWNL